MKKGNCMKTKIISTVLISLFIFTNSYLMGNDRDYSKLFHVIMNSISHLEISEEKTELIKDSNDLTIVLENGLTSFNVLAPYTKMEKDIKAIIKNLSNYKFTLRSARSTEIYNNAVKSTVLIVAPEIGSGAGFVIDESKGLVVTNFHVTRGLKNVLVAFYNKNIQDPSNLNFYPASVIRYSAKKDISILKISSLPNNIQELNWGKSKELNVGGKVHTIGHPLSLTWTYSHGLITAIRKKFRFGEEERANVIQMDVSISPGNSGGPLLNDNGKVVGVVTFSSSSKYAQNLNFAISSQEIKRILSLKKNEETTVSLALKKLYGTKLFSLEDVLRECNAYRVDEDEDGKYDYISLINSETKNEEFRYIKDVEIEINPGEKQNINVLAMDITQDETMDILFFDFDSDKKFDAIAADTNLDGKPDIIGMDTEGGGQITRAWIL